jgi:hypothetical protein
MSKKDKHKITVVNWSLRESIEKHERLRKDREKQDNDKGGKSDPDKDRFPYR